MKFQNAQLPPNATYAAATSLMDENTVPQAILQKHMAPKGKCGYLKVLEGALQFIWEDTGDVLDADTNHPIVIFPERLHHVKLIGPVVFKIEFYAIPDVLAVAADVARPGERFL